LAVVAKKGEKKKSYIVAKEMINENEPVKKITKYTGLSEAEIIQLKE